MFIYQLLLMALLVLSVVASVPPIVIRGNKFFNSSDGSQFFIKGVAYQRNRREGEVYDVTLGPRYIDSLAEPSLCLRDMEYLKELGVNTVRVYQIDSDQSHDVCMNAFANSGIYVLADLGEPEQSINRDDPHWDLDLYERFTSVVDAMSSYPNVLGFYIGNEVITSPSNSNSAPFVKAAVRDIKRYVRNMGYRGIPIGYSSNDDAATRLESANYFVCDEYNGTDSAVDFYSLNMFEWCGYSSFATSGYKERTIEFAQLPVPVFFSEFGCNTVTPRPFTEMESLYGPSMSKVWSGGIVYEFFQNENKYGLVEETSPGVLRKLDDYRIVQLRFMESKPVGVQKSWNTESRRGQVKCPVVSSTWNASSVLPKFPSPEVCECLDASLSCILTPYVKIHETDLLYEVCSVTDCSKINGNGSQGKYGVFSVCGIKQRISYALNKHWVQNDRNPNACNFGSRAVLIANREDASVDSTFTADGKNCRDVLGKCLDSMQKPTVVVPSGTSQVSVASTGITKFVQSRSKSGSMRVLI